MLVKAKINVLDATHNGISKATGKPWVNKECVIEFLEEGHEHPHTIACTASMPEVIEKMEKCEVGDVVNIDLHFVSQARTFTYKNGAYSGQQGVDRNTKAYIIDFNVI